MKGAIAFGLIGVGLLLLVLSGLWPTLFPGTSLWTEAKAARWAEIKDRLHNLSFLVNNPRARVSMHSGPELGTAKAEYDRIKQEGEQLRLDFETAANRPQTVSAVLKWSGISLASLGVIGWYVVRNSS
jgi:hypothetical protein